MSMLWQEIDSPERWEAHPCNAQPPVVFAHQRFRLLTAQDGLAGQTVLIAEPDARIALNGRDVIGGIGVLQHQDELRVDGRRWYYSAHSQPEIVRYQSGGSRSPRCPVCRGKVEAEQLMVRCPGCGRLYHQADDSQQPASEATASKKCWTYREHCKFCQHPTALTGDSSWRPTTEEAEYE